MIEAMETIKNQVLGWPAPERAELASLLLASLDGGEIDAPVVAEAWKHEIRRRIVEMDSGKAEGIPAEKAFADLRRKYA